MNVLNKNKEKFKKNKKINKKTSRFLCFIDPLISHSTQKQHGSVQYYPLQSYSLFNTSCHFLILYRELAQADSQRHTYLKALEDNQREKAQLERQLEMERMKVESERKKLMLAQEALSDKVG